MPPVKRQYVRASDGTTAEPPPPPVPVDLLLEILALLDVKTIVRCAATSKAVRRAILDNQAFFGRRVEANGGAFLLGISYILRIQALLQHINKAQATLMELPPSCVRRVRSLCYDHRSLRLAASTDGELCLHVAEVCVISMWTLSSATAEQGGSSSAMPPPAARWTRQVVIRREAIGREGLAGGFSARFLGFGELSGTAILLIDQIGLIQINLRTKEAIVIGSDGFKGVDAGALLDPAFRRRRLALDDALLLGVSYVFRDTAYSTFATGDGQLPRKHSSRFDAGLLDPFDPVAWRGSVVILRRRVQANFDFEMRACDALTGHTSRLPSPGHIFSSEDGEWGAVVETDLPPHFTFPTPKHGFYPLVLGDTVVHWLCGDDRHVVVALCVSTSRATLIELPHSPQQFDTAVQLAASPNGRLSLLVAEASDDTVSMWTLSAAAAAEEEARWTKTVVMDMQAISRDCRGCLARFLGFGERTGTVIMLLDGVGLVQINLGSKKARVLSRAREFKRIANSDLRLCLHETDLCSVLQAMRPF
ncbi:hypothetical protein BAE44_0018309 [Dichanthelium oligosanthes]|uniref:Uncharacterized protein n=1 Tax=Dichanthelium oligosanthes TaxID=888268 RepID=A0A1E5V688_9POAL|nr:hypothetical protein BAE44_0018309 [Dichanthelium oligosanthes]